MNTPPIQNNKLLKFNNKNARSDVENYPLNISPIQPI